MFVVQLSWACCLSGSKSLQRQCEASSWLGMLPMMSGFWMPSGLTDMPQSGLTDMPQKWSYRHHMSGLTGMPQKWPYGHATTVVLQTSMPQKWSYSMAKCAAFRSFGRLHAQAVARVLQLLHATMAVLPHATRVVLQTCHISGLTDMPHEWSYRHATKVVLQTCHMSGLTDKPQEWSYRHAT